MLAFVVILALTVLVWFAVAMSEVCKNTIVVKVEMTGFDRSQYAVVQIDSVMNVQVESTGFNALLYSLKPVGYDHKGLFAVEPVDGIHDGGLRVIVQG